LVLASAVTAVLAIAIGLGFLAILRPLQGSAPVPHRPAEPASAQLGKPRQTVVLQPPLVLKVRTVPVTAGDAPVLSGFKPPLRLEPPYQIVDSTTLRSGDRTVRLAFLSGLKRNELCRALDGQRYACGLRGLASLARATAGKPITCWPVFGPKADGDRYRCFTEGRDLGTQQAEQGYARPLSPVYGYRAGKPLENPTADLASPDMGYDQPSPGSADEPEN
jgi:endonuclease YncB( thermonuclease family)